MPRERSLRFRLTLWYALVLCAALTLLSGLIWVSLRQRLRNEVDQALSGSAARLQAYVVEESSENPPVDLMDELEEFCQGLPSSDHVQLRGARGFAFDYPTHKPPVVEGRRSVSHQFRIGNDTFTLEISSSLAPIDHTLDLLRNLLLGLVPLIVVVACAGGAWLSRRALKPVDEVTFAARGIGIDNLSLRLRTPQTGDELQRLTEVWNSMLARLEEAVRTLSQFAADASHELRTPLAVIRTSAELALRRARSPESYRESLIEIAQEAERMTRLVDDLLFLARSDARAAEMPLELVECRELLRQVCEELRGVAERRGIRIRPVAAPPDALISGNPDALRRLFLVLIDNAIKYSHPDSEVIVAVERTMAHVSVSVQDFGVGITAEDQPHIFKRFYQADKARSDEGFGLGLSLAGSIAKAHNATIRVTSTEALGATFTVVFAAALSGTPEASPHSLAAVTPESAI